MEMGADADIGATIHPHPTLSETVGMDAEAFEGTITDLYLPKKAGPPQREGRFPWQRIRKQAEPDRCADGWARTNPGGPGSQSRPRVVRATEAAAIACSRYMGLGDKEQVDQAAIEAMRPALGSVRMNGVVVIGKARRTRRAHALQRRACW